MQSGRSDARSGARERAKRGPALVALAMAAALSTSACFGAPRAYRVTEFAGIEDGPVPAGEGGIVRGRPAPIVDGLNHYLFSLPAKLLYFNWRMHDHRLPPESEELLRDYLALNGLSDKVLVRHNQWAPLDEWRRLRANTEVAAIYRYTIGLYYLGYYTLLPPRLFGGTFLALGDRFNPYTNSISLYTSEPAFVVHEGGHAKDYSEARYKGTWGAILETPPGALWYEYSASADAVRFAHCMGRDDLERRFYRRLTPAYGSYIGGYASYLVPGGQLVVAAGIGVGHVVGQLQAGVRRVATWFSGDDRGPSGVSPTCAAFAEDTAEPAAKAGSPGSSVDAETEPEAAGREARGEGASSQSLR